MRVRISGVFLIVISLLASQLFAQDAVSNGEGALETETTEHTLQRFHIAHTEPALIKALRSHHWEVRVLAAFVLAEDGAKDAIPAIEEVLRTETVPGHQVNIAFSLARLGESTGRETLKSMCADSTQLGSDRMLAAVYMRDLHDDSCLPYIVQVLQSGGDVDGQIQALYLVPSFRHLPEEGFQPLFGLVVRALTDPESRIRMTASSVLGQIGDVSAIPYLRNALAKESDEGSRITMQLVLQQLEKKKR
jgi:HEAT repeat protein